MSISEYSRDFLLNLYPGENLKEKFHIVHCGVSPEQFVPPACKELNRPSLIFTISQLAERKGFPVLVEACQILAERGCDFHCIIAGDGPQLQDKVQLMGTVFQEQLAHFFNRTDVFVLPCLTTGSGDVDGIPVVLMEAMAMELPVISTYVSGIPELITQGQSGLLVNEKDAPALADAIQCLLEDREHARKLGQNGRAKVVAEFNSKKSATQLAALFEKFV